MFGRDAGTTAEFFWTAGLFTLRAGVDMKLTGLLPGIGPVDRGEILQFALKHNF
jgi:hypothetical protein